MPIMLFVILALIFVILLIVVTNIVIVPQSMVYVVERLGSYSDTWSAGLHVKIPFIERIAKKVSLKEQVADFPPQPVITRDNVTMQIDTVVFFQVMDAKLYTYGVNQPIAAIESLSATTLRNIIGEMELDHTLTSRDVINGKITAILDEATDKWGIKVNRDWGNVKRISTTNILKYENGAYTFNKPTWSKYAGTISTWSAMFSIRYTFN